MKKVILFVILLFHLGICYSQSISVSNFKLLESDLTANTAGTIERDQNGEVAALIKVVTTQTGFTFDCGSMGIVKTVQKPAEIWVYVPHGIKKMTISHPQLGLLRDYYLNVPIEKARTYEMVLASGTVQTIINQDAGGQYLIMNVDPPTATVFIDDSEVTVNNGVISKFLSYGSHNYRISDPLYQSDAGTFEIGKEKKEINAKLLPSYGVLEISTTPENGAKVFLDNDTEPMGTTPFITRKIVKGDHRFRFQMPSYESKTMTYNVHSDGSTKPLSVALIPNFANITIKVPEGSTLYINNENKGYSDWSGRLSEGLYLLEARKESHITTKQTITVVKGEEQNISLPNPTPIYGGLNINSTPIGAKVLIDGKEIGKTPEIFNQLLIGKHTLQVIKDGYESDTRSINIERGSIVQITAELKKKEANTSYDNSVKASNKPSTVINTTIDTNLSDINSLKKQYKKDPSELVRIGRSLYEKKRVTEAREFANAALTASKNKYAPAHILLGDIAVLADDGAAAAAWYEQAIYADPKNPDAYYKYANVYRKISPSDAVTKLNELRAQRPDVAVDALVGRIYYMSNYFDKALAAYDKADKNKMEERDLSDYAMSAFFKQKYDKALEVAKFGLSKNPRHAAFNRLAFFNLTELKRYDEALQYADALFHKSDSAKFSYYDYTYYGNAYAGAKQHEKAIEMYELALSQEDLDNKTKRAGVVKLLSDAYKAKEDYPNAIKYYKEYIANIEKPTANDIAGLAGLYVVQANSIKILNEKKTVLIEADAVYADLASKYENAVEYATFMRARVNAQMDPDSKLGLAKPYYEKLIELIEPRAEKDATERARIIESYRYMIAYNFIVLENTPVAKEYATKLQAIDPENEIAKQILETK